MHWNVLYMFRIQENQLGEVPPDYKPFPEPEMTQINDTIRRHRDTRYTFFSGDQGPDSI